MRINSNYNSFVVFNTKFNNVSFGEVNTDKKMPEENRKISGVSKDNTSIYYLPLSLNKNKPVNATGITRDRFTGLRDKNCLLRKVDEKKALAAKQGKKLQIAMFDMDNFKSVNEILSYETGDVFIKKIAEIIKRNAEGENVGSYRFGGEEFVVMTTDTSPEKIKALSTKIKNEIETDKDLCSYKAAYASALNSRLSKLEENNQILQLIETQKTELNLFEELIDADSSLLDNDVFIDRYKKTVEDLRTYNKVLINHAIKKERNPETKKWLETQFTRLSSPSKNYRHEVLLNDNLYKYFDEKYNKRSEIYQIKKWLNDFNRNSFSITCGIVNVTPSEFADKSAIELVNSAGEILKEGKHIQKGEVYLTQMTE